MDENKMPENDGWKKNARLAIYAMAGFYLLTLAYQMFRAISTSHGNEQLVMIVATILFLIVDRVWNYKCLQKHEKESEYR